MGNIKKAAGLAGKLARKGLDKADETRNQRNEAAAAAARQREADFVANLELHDFNQEVVGESHYQEALTKIVGKQKDGEGSYWRGSAVIRHDQGNKHDKWAIVVAIDGNRVGYLPSDPANKALIDTMSGQARRLPARINGGFSLDEGGTAYFGVRLVLDD